MVFESFWAPSVLWCATLQWRHRLFPSACVAGASGGVGHSFASHPSRDMFCMLTQSSAQQLQIVRENGCHLVRTDRANLTSPPEVRAISPDRGHVLAAFTRDTRAEMSFCASPTLGLARRRWRRGALLVSCCICAGHENGRSWCPALPHLRDGGSGTSTNVFYLLRLSEQGQAVPDHVLRDHLKP